MKRGFQDEFFESKVSSSTTSSMSFFPSQKMGPFELQSQKITRAIPIVVGKGKCDSQGQYDFHQNSSHIVIFQAIEITRLGQRLQATLAALAAGDQQLKLLRNMESLAKDLNVKNQLLEGEIDRLTQDKTQLELIIEELKNQRQGVNDYNGQSEAEFRRLTADLRAVQEKLVSLEGKYTATTEQLRQTDHQLEIVKFEAGNLFAQNQQLRSLNSRLEDDIVCLKEQWGLTQNNFAESNERENKMKTLAQDYEKEYEYQKQHSRKLEVQVVQLTAQIQSLQLKLNRLQTQLQQTEISQLQAKSKSPRQAELERELNQSIRIIYALRGYPNIAEKMQEIVKSLNLQSQRESYLPSQNPAALQSILSTQSLKNSPTSKSRECSDISPPSEADVTLIDGIYELDKSEYSVLQANHQKKIKNKSSVEVEADVEDLLLATRRVESIRVQEDKIISLAAQLETVIKINSTLSHKLKQMLQLSAHYDNLVGTHSKALLLIGSLLQQNESLYQQLTELKSHKNTFGLTQTLFDQFPQINYLKKISSNSVTRKSDDYTFHESGFEQMKYSTGHNFQLRAKHYEESATGFKPSKTTEHTQFTHHHLPPTAPHRSRLDKTGSNTFKREQSPSQTSSSCFSQRDRLHRIRKRVHQATEISAAAIINNNLKLSRNHLSGTTSSMRIDATQLDPSQSKQPLPINYKPFSTNNSLEKDSNVSKIPKFQKKTGINIFGENNQHYVHFNSIDSGKLINETPQSPIQSLPVEQSIIKILKPNSSRPLSNQNDRTVVNQPAGSQPYIGPASSAQNTFLNSNQTDSASNKALKFKPFRQLATIQTSKFGQVLTQSLDHIDTFLETPKCSSIRSETAIEQNSASKSHFQKEDAKHQQTNSPQLNIPHSFLSFSKQPN